jgi:hypothetical protein
MKDEHLDKLFQRKLSGDRDFPFDESNWNNFQRAMADRQKSNKRRFLPLILLLIATSGLFIATSVRVFMNGKHTIAKMGKYADKQQATNTAHSSQEKEGVVLLSVPPHNTPPTQQVESFEQKQSSKVLTESKMKEEKSITDKKINLLAAKTATEPSYFTPKNNSSKKDKDYAPKKDNKKIPHFAHSNQSKNEDLNSASINKSEKQNLANEAVVQQNNPLLKGVAQNISAKMQPSIAAVNEQNNDTTAHSVEEIAAITHSPDSNTITPKESYKNKKHTFSVWSGINASGLSQKEWEANPAVRPTIGVGYSYQLLPNLSLQTGLGYAQHTDKHNTIRYESKFYDFGATETQLRITYKNLHFLEIPIQLSYQISRKQRIAAGLQYMQLFHTNGSLEKWQDNRITPITQRKWEGNGYYAGLTTRLYLVNIRYDYFLHKNWSLAAQVAYSTQKMTDNAAVYREKPLQFKLFIHYHFLRF